MLLGSGEGKHLHVESRFGQDANHEKTFFHGVLPVCFLSVSTSSSPTNSAITAKSNIQGLSLLLRAGTKGTLIYYPSCVARRRVYVGIPALLLAFPPPPYRDLFFVQPCTPSNLQRIFFPFLKRWGQNVEDGQDLFVLEKIAHTHKHFSAHTHTHTCECTSSVCPRNEPWLI